MVHSTYAQGHVMGGRDIHSPLGIPKSPSFHSGLDLVASVGVEESLKKALDQHETTGFPGKISFYPGNISNFPETFNGNSTQTPAGESQAVTFGNSFSSIARSFGISSGNIFGKSDSNVLTMINGKTKDSISGNAFTGTMQNGLGLSAQALAFQNNSTAVRSMQAMGQLPSLKGIVHIKCQKSIFIVTNASSVFKN